MKYLELILRCLTALLRVIFPQHPPVPETTDATGAAPSPASPPFALELVRQLAGKEEADRIQNAIAYRHSVLG